MTGRMRTLLKKLILFSALALMNCPRLEAAPQRFLFESGGPRYLVVEVLTDTLFHFELAENRSGPSPDQGIFTTPMVAQKMFVGPSKLTRVGDTLETPAARLTVEKGSLCVSIRDLRKGADLSRICGENLDQGAKALLIDRSRLRNAYGIGNFFYDPGTADGDWAGRHWDGDGLGNVRKDFNGAAPSMSQFPVAYLLGERKEGFALFLDQVYRMSWDFRGSPNWAVRTWGDQLRFYAILGDDLPNLRSQFMELVGRPLIPPRATFGLWVSEFGYDNWDEIRTDLASLRSNHIPVDGFGLDLQWFGGTFGDPNNAKMGSLQFDPKNFADAPRVVKDLRMRDGIQLMAIEESYVDARLPEYARLLPWSVGDLQFCLVARNEEGRCDPSMFGSRTSPMWWGYGSMIDWTNPEAGKTWHQLKRHELAKLGITAHWTDLGEPEMYNPGSYYHGLEGLPSKNRHADIHNLYAFHWHKSIFDGYTDPQNSAELAQLWNLPAGPRHYVMSRAGAPGMQRFGAGMWSGDTGRNQGTLRAHMNTQMHMSLAGLDYYSSDAGGFTSTFGVGIEPGYLPGQHDNELYTQWFADSAWSDIPLKPHGWAYGADETQYGPDHRGHMESNRANVRQRYELAPYLYSLAHRAYLAGEPIVPPMVYQFQDDSNARSLGNVKMLGPSIAFGIVAGFGQTERRMYLPAGTWINYHSGEWFDSAGTETEPLPLYRERDGSKGLFTLPAFARAGAILPIARIDEQTMNFSGKRMDGTTPVSNRELRVRVYADSKPTSFSLYEDDGESRAYESGAVRVTRITQAANASGEEVIIEPAHGTYAGAPDARDAVLELHARDAQARSVSVDGNELERCASQAELESGRACWINALSGAGPAILVRAGRAAVSSRREFRVELEPAPRTVSVHLVCDGGRTQNGEAIYAMGSTPALGGWDAARAVRLEPVHFPRWAGVVQGLPPGQEIEWKCIKRRESGGPAIEIQPGSNLRFKTPDSGYAGTSWGSLP